MRTISLSLVLLLAATAPALADDDVGTPTDGARLHDGFYLRLGTGFGGYAETITLEDATQHTQVSGMASVSELMIGGAVRPGFILGGGVWTSSVMTSERTVGGMEPPDEVLTGSGSFTLAGPFIDWYFHPRRGLHFQAAVGFATVRGYDLPEAEDNPDAASLGGGAMLGFGYDWWVSDQWSCGILARVVGVGAVQEDDNHMRWTHGIGTSPSLLFTATLN